MIVADTVTGETRKERNTMKKAQQNLINDIRAAVKEEQQRNRDREMTKLMVVLGNNAHEMKYSELRKHAFMAKAYIDMIIAEVKNEEKALDLLERYLQDKLTGGELENIIRGE